MYDDYNISEDTRVICDIVDESLSLFICKFEIYDITLVSEYKSEPLSVSDKMYSIHSTLTAPCLDDCIEKYKSIFDNIDYDITTMKVNGYEFHMHYSDK